MEVPLLEQQQQQLMIMSQNTDNNNLFNSSFPPPNHYYFLNAWSMNDPTALLDFHLPDHNYSDYPLIGDFQPILNQQDSPEEITNSFIHQPQFPTQQQDYYSSNNDANIINAHAFEEERNNTEMMINNNIPFYGEKKIKVEKPQGQPSKNLMAERRRRKRLNDRLSMLRSIVPKISKMDRTSIVGDTIDYMRELLGKIHKLREDDHENLDHQDNMKLNLIGNYLKELKPNDMLARSPPKFNVERRIEETRVEVCCPPKPGLLLSTLSTMDALGLDVQQCVISCFNDFSVQASCCEVDDCLSLISCEDAKHALFLNAGYGGRCV